MSTWTRDELEAAFERYQEQVRRAATTGDWTHFADLFTDDATYLEHAYGAFRGRDEICVWVVDTMTSPPGCWMTDFPPSWHVIDEERGRIVCEIRNVMPDPGDGSVHEATNITILGYAGNDRFDYEEDVYNPGRFVSMLQEWARVAAVHDRLPEGADAWLDAAVPGWRG
ncbi:MAG: hypothetical protein ACJ71Z_03315 [Aeromicrobium sp.]